MSITWVSTADVEEALGSPVGDPTWLAQVTDAANAWAFRRRLNAGYSDDSTLVPGPDVALGTVLYAKALYSERGAVDGFSSFEALEGFTPAIASLGQINRLLGISRPAVA